MTSNSTDSSLNPTQGPPDHNVFFGQPTIGVAVMTIVLSTFFTGLRVWSRAVILRVFALEDWLLLLGWLFATAFSAGNLAQLQTGLGRSFASLSPSQAVIYLKVAWSLNVCYAVGLTSVKISILCLYLRALRYGYVPLATKILLVIVAITHIWIIASLFTVCVPLAAFWDFTQRKGAYCHDFSVYWSHAGINITTDFLIFALPLTVLRKLRIPRRQKYALGVAFMLAFLVCIISIIRTLQFIHGMGDRDTVVIASWTMTEVNVAVICACLITINPALSRMFPRIWVETSDMAPFNVPVVETIGHAQRNRSGSHDSLVEELDTDTSLKLGPESEGTVPGSMEGTGVEEKGHRNEAKAVSKEV